MEQFNWSSGISLATLLGVVFFGGVFVQMLKGIRVQLDTVVDKTLPRIHERLDSSDKWRARFEGAEEERERPARNERPITDPTMRRAGT